jgi:uncharacterized membrane protein YhaH (DUF805 family)
MQEQIIAAAKDIFTIEGTRNRKSYIIRALQTFAVSFVMAFIFGFLGVFPIVNLISVIGFPVLFLAAGAAQFCLAFTRLADLGISKFWAILVVAPVINIILMIFLAVTAKQESTSVNQ